MAQANAELSVTRRRLVPINYSELLAQALFDVRFVRSPGAFLQRSFLATENAAVGFGDAVNDFKQLLEEYERRLSRSKPEQDLRPFHKEVEYGFRATILGLGKARRSDLKGAAGWWAKADTHFTLAAVKLREVIGIYADLVPCLESMLGSDIDSVSIQTWPPLRAA